MELVKDINEIIENAKRADYYLNKGTLSERGFLIDKIKNGRCFVVIKEGEEYKFYPSKYIGYKDNNPEAYCDALDNFTYLDGQFDRYGSVASGNFDGRMSNKALNKVLKCRCEKNYEMSEKFIEYCNNLGLKGSDKKKFWSQIIEI